MATTRVRAGEGWTAIAQRTLGDQGRFRDLIAANPGIDVLQPGDAITVPSQPRQSRTFATETPGGRRIGATRTPQPIATETPGGRPIGTRRAPQPPTPERAGQAPFAGAFPGGPQSPTTPDVPPIGGGFQRPFDIGSIQDRLGGQFSGAVPGGASFFQTRGRSYEDIAGVQQITPQYDSAGNLIGYEEAIPGSSFGRETDNPVQVLRNRLISDPDFTMDDLADFGVYGFWDTPFGRQQVGAPMRNVEDRMVTSFLDFVERQRDIYGEDWQFEIRDETDAQILERLGLLERETGRGGGGGRGFGGYGGYGSGTPTQMLGRGQAPRSSRQSSYIQLVNWRI